MKRQNGAALFVGMLFLLILSFLGGVMLSSSNQGLKVVSAMSDRIGAEHLLEGTMNELLMEPSLQTQLGTMGNGASMAISTIVAGANGTLSHSGDGECARSLNASSNNVINCRYVRGRLSQDYGKASSSTTAMAAGIEQPVLASQ